jgi:hypothetical protein
MLLRLIPELGGNGTIISITAMNDTGSDVSTLFASDLLLLNNPPGYQGWQWPVGVTDANGTTTFYPCILVQVQLAREDDMSWSYWIFERAIVKPHLTPRLSGVGIRQALYIHRYCTRQRSLGD